MGSSSSKFRIISASKRAYRSEGIFVVFLLAACCLPLDVWAQNNQPADLNNRIEQARSLERLREYDRAAAVFEKVLQDAPDNMSALNGVLRLYFQLEAFDKAIALLETRIEKAPGNISFRRRLAEAFFRTDRTGEAEEQIGLLLDLFPKNEGVVHQIGSLYTSRKHYEKAVKAYISGRQRLGKPDAFALQLAGIYTTMLDVPGAVREYVRWLTVQPAQLGVVNDRIDQLTGFSSQELVERALRKAVSEHRDSKDAHNLFGNFFLRHDKPREALGEYREADRLDGSSGTYLIRFAEWALREEHHQDAVETYLELIRSSATEPLRAAATTGLATAYRKMGTYDTAAATYREIIAMYPESSYREEAAFHLAGIYLSHHHDARQALDAYRTLLTDAPATEFQEEAMFGIAESYVVLGSLEDAVAQYNRILDPESGFKDPETHARVSFHLGEMALYQGRLDDALEKFHESADRYTDSSYANDALEWTILLAEGRSSGDDSLNEYIRSSLLRRQFNNQEALDVCKRYVENNPESLIVDTVILDIGLILDNIGKPYQAVAAFRDLIERQPESRRLVAAQWHIAEIYETKIGDIPQALTEYETLLVSYPNHFNNDAVRRKIRELTENHPPIP